MVIKKYQISFIYGIINPVERKIEIETSNELNEDFIRNEIIKSNKKYENQIQAILSCLLIGERTIEDIPIFKEQEEISDYPKDRENSTNMSFNW